jgi:competence protein ComEA
MNPFLDSTVAVPLASAQAILAPQKQPERLSGRWSFPFTPQASNRLARRARVAVMLAGVGVGLSAQALDLNTATAEQLQNLRGVGPRTAQIIVQERNRAGPFESLEDLSDRVRGIGLKRLQALQASGLRVSAASTAASGVSAKGPNGSAQAAVRRVALPSGVATPTIEPAPSQ